MPVVARLCSSESGKHDPLCLSLSPPTPHLLQAEARGRELGLVGKRGAEARRERALERRVATRKEGGGRHWFGEYDEEVRAETIRMGKMPLCHMNSAVTAKGNTYAHFRLSISFFGGRGGFDSCLNLYSISESG